MLADVFVNFRNMCLKIHEPDPTNVLSAPGLELQVALKNTKVKLDIYVINGRKRYKKVNISLYLSICKS